MFDTRLMPGPEFSILQARQSDSAYVMWGVRRIWKRFLYMWKSTTEMAANFELHSKQKSTSVSLAHRSAASEPIALGITLGGKIIAPELPANAARVESPVWPSE